MGGYKRLSIGRIDPENDKLLEEEAVRAGTAKAGMARRYVRECFMGMIREVLTQVGTTLAYSFPHTVTTKQEVL